MTKKHNVKAQLRRIGADFKFWGKSEARELENVLFDDEVILHALNGRYNGGLGLLCATDRRLLLLDKKPLFLTFEDMQYEMISEVDFTEQTICARLVLMTPAKVLEFKSYRIRKLRDLTQFIQQRVANLHKYHDGYADDTQHVMQQPHVTKSMYAQLGEIASSNIEQADHQPQYGERQSVMYPMNPYRNLSLRSRRRVPKFTPPLPPIEG